MLGRDGPKRRQTPGLTDHSVFGSAVTVTGDLDADDPIRIEGIMEGDVRGTEVTVGRRASVKGTIRAETVRVAGAVEGRIEAATVSVASHARIIGEVRCATLAIEPGAEIGARCKAWPEGEDTDAEDTAESKEAAPA